MLLKSTFNTSKIIRTNMTIPQAVIAQGLIYVSGTGGIDPQTGRVVNDIFEDQARQAFTNIKTI